MELITWLGSEISNGWLNFTRIEMSETNKHIASICVCWKITDFQPFLTNVLPFSCWKGKETFNPNVWAQFAPLFPHFTILSLRRLFYTFFVYQNIFKKRGSRYVLTYLAVKAPKYDKDAKCLQIIGFIFPVDNSSSDTVLKAIW